MPQTQPKHFRRNWRAFKRQLDDPAVWSEYQLSALLGEFLSAVRNGAFDDKRSAGQRRDVVLALAYQLGQVERLWPYLAPADDRERVVMGARVVLAGDVTNNGRAELGFVVSNPFDTGSESSWRQIAARSRAYELPQSGVWLFQRDPVLGWSHLATVPSYLVPPIPVAEYCRDAVVDHWQVQEASRKTGLPALGIHQDRYAPGHAFLPWRVDDLAEARRYCPAIISAVELDPGTVTLYLSSYGRAAIQATCNQHGCSATSEAVRFDSNIEGVVRVRTGSGKYLQLLATGCWREDGDDAYSLWGNDLASAPQWHYMTSFAGKPMITSIDDERFAIAITRPCGGLMELPLVAGPIRGINAYEPKIMLARVDAGG